MRELALDEVKSISLEILKEIDDLCRKHGITYFLAYGTLIGAIRHKGFIPWDDDIDIWVPIEHYESLLNVLEKESKYQLLSSLTNQNWPHAFSKLSHSGTKIVNIQENSLNLERGVAVDLFPLHYYSKNTINFTRLRFCSKMSYWLYMSRRGICDQRNNVKHKVIKLVTNILRLFNMDELYWKKRLTKLMFANKDSDYVGFFGSLYGKRDIHSKELFSKAIRVEFEGASVLIPEKYDDILRNLYGNYMQMPPKEKRVTHHNVKRYWID